MKRLVIVFAFLLASSTAIITGCASSEKNITGYSKEKIEEVTSFVAKSPLTYRMYFPLDMDQNDPLKFGKLSLCVYLHDKHTDPSVGLDCILAYVNDNKIKTVVVAPLCHDDIDWYDRESLVYLEYLINTLSRSWLIDEDRVYLTGFGSGGLGVWEYALRYPGTVTTIAPVCGGVSIMKTTKTPVVPEQFYHLNIWAVHYLDDRVVSSDLSKKIVGQVWAKSVGLAKFTEIVNGGHTADIYSNPAFLGWIFNTKRSYAQ